MGPQLDLAARKAATSVTRQLGTTWQSAPFDLSLALKVINGGKVALTAGSPVDWGNLVVTPAYFVTREMKVARSQGEHITVIPSESKVLFMLTVSKADSRTMSCRAWQCLRSSSDHGTQARDD